MENIAENLSIKKIELPEVSEEGLKNITMGVRKITNTQSRRNRFKKYTKKKLIDTFNSTSAFERTLMLLLAEHKTFSTPQLQVFFTIAHNRSSFAFDGLIGTIFKKYDIPVPKAEEIFTTGSPNMLYKKLERMRKKGLVDSIRVRANNIEIDKEIAPALMYSHHFLTEFGTQVIAAGSSTYKRNDIVGFAPNYKTYSFNSLLHLTECNDFFISTIAAAQDMMNNNLDVSGILDIVRWDNEITSTHKFDYNPNEPVLFKPDGSMVIFSSKLGNFLSFYLEHDVGDSTRKKIAHKTSSYLKFILYKKNTDQKNFRKPVLLFVTSSNHRIKLHQQVIKSTIQKEWASNIDYLNFFGRIAITTTQLIQDFSPLGEIWTLVDLKTGEIIPEQYNLLSLSWAKEE